MSKVILLNGAPRSGKGLFAEIYADNAPQGTRVVKTSVIDSIKDVAQMCFGWNGVKDADGRKLLSDLYLASMAYNYAPLDNIIKMVFMGDKSTVFIIDVRAPRDIDILKITLKNCGIECLRVLITRLAACPGDLPADCDTHMGIYDKIISNDGTPDEFREKIIKYIL